MKKIIVRADDLGYSCAVNYGIYEATHRGIVNNVSLMVNLPFSEHGWELLKNEPDTDVGLHVVIGETVERSKTGIESGAGRWEL